MEPVVEPDELMDRIRRAADRENGAVTAPGASGAVSEPSSLPEARSHWVVTALTVDLFDHAMLMLRSARAKNEVPTTVPKFLRPLYRNQGGFNGVIIETIERVITSNRQFVEQMGKFRDWAEMIGQESRQHRAGAKDQTREAFREERLVEIEVRLNRLEPSGGNVGNPPTVAPLAPAPPLETRLTDLLARTERLETERASHAELANQLHAQQARLAQLEAQLARLQTPASPA